MSDDARSISKGDYKNFMSKEIFEQPITIKNCMNEYIDKIRNQINLYDFPIQPDKIDKITLIACGTAYHSWLQNTGLKKLQFRCRSRYCFRIQVSKH